MSQVPQPESDGVVRRVRRTADAVVLELTGEVDLHRSVALRGVLLDIMEEKPPRLVIVMQDVEFMDSSGLATLVEALQISRRNGTKLFLVGLRPRVRSIFEISRLDGIFSICRDEAEALSA